MPPIFPASTTMGGQCMAAPDVCKTPAPPAPPIPIPYPNIAMVMQATPASTKVKFAGKEVVTQQSKIPATSGDNPGVAGGVVSGANMQEASFKKGSSKIMIEGQPCIHLTAVSGHNGVNANAPAGVQVAPSQVKVIINP